MAINVLKKINEKDACSILMKEKQELFVVNVDEIKPSTRRENQYYCYVDFEIHGRIVLIMVFAKNEMENLSKAERNSLKALIASA